MNALKKARTPTRGLITRTINEVEAELRLNEVDIILLKTKYERLNELQIRIQELDQNIFEVMLADQAVTEEEQMDESIACEDILTRMVTTKLKIEQEITQLERMEKGSINDDTTTVIRKRQFKLPKIELKKFSGKILDWLSWWAQFSKIHEDEELHATDKFQYLIQSMEPHTKGDDIVKGFPATAANYPKVIEALTERFGRKKLLVQVYIKELFRMGLNNMNARQSVISTYDKLIGHIRSLESLNITIEQTSLFLYPMVEASLPEEVLVAWQRSAKYDKDGSLETPPKSELDYLLEFLQQEVEREEQRALVKGALNNNKWSARKETSFPTAAALQIKEERYCIFCGKQHANEDCSMSVQQKWKEILRKRICGKCLRSGHKFSDCNQSQACPDCKKDHHKLLCKKPRTGAVIKTNAGSNNVHNSLVILKAITLSIMLNENDTIEVRGLLDDGSQRSYISTHLASTINAKMLEKYFERNTLFGGVVTDIEERTVFEVPLRGHDGTTYKLELASKDKITGKIDKLPYGPWIRELKSLNISISDYDSSLEEIDILIGADLLPRVTKDCSVSLNCGLKAVETIFGWTIMGPISREVHCNTGIQLATNMINEADISQLWKLEAIGIRDPFEVKSREERDLDIQEEFEKKISYTDDGKYQVSLPWVDGVQDIPNNFAISKKRLINATKKLKQKGMYDIYNGLLKQWEQEDFIEEVKGIPLENCHYIPHHPVYKPDSKTTPVRPVFDASCKIGRCPSLNECLEKGPNLIELIPAVMIQFRDGLIGVLSDVRKAFQMIFVNEGDQMFLLFLWWEDDSETKLKVFKHKRVVFGLKCSPFILGAVINHHLDKVCNADKEIAEKLKKSLYVDNSITAVHTMEEYVNFKENAVRILAEANMELRQWEHTLRDDNVHTEEIYSSVLGMRWNKRTDTISCASVPEIPNRLSKRTILAIINKIYDPLGILTPAMIFPKILLQSTWRKNIGWDEEVPQEIKNDFVRWANGITCLQTIEVQRNFRGNFYMETNSSEQIHVFCDASKMAYAAVAFLRVETDTNVSVQLIQAKSRVAPLQKITSTRIELMACTIGARLGNSIKKAFNRSIECCYWSDSTTALAWIHRNDEWGTFVGNRVKEIVQFGIANNWKHIPGKYNPADFPSRGGSPRELQQSIWWEGPQWLKNPMSEWPNEKIEIDENAVNAERKKAVKCNSNLKILSIIKDPWYSKRSSHLLNLRHLALLKRFCYNCLAKKQGTERRTGHLTPTELSEAERIMVKMVQKEVFPSKAEFIAGLKVDKDPDEIYCVVTKLLHRQDSGRFKKPLLLPCVHPDVEKLIIEEHERFGHAGAHFLVNKLRERFWIIHAKKAVKRIIKKCTTCIRFNRRPVTVPVAPLPENRIKNAKVFEVTGIDLAGPLYLKNNQKQWIIIFTCAVFRAVHLEVVSNINTEEFILALSRFISRRGRPAIIYTDCGTNFVATSNLFGKINWDKVSKDSRLQRITWIFNPPASPWWGGFWERLIRVVKEYLRKLLGHNKLTKTELETSLCFVESLMNGRPLTYVSDDPEDLIPLTPAAFLQDIEHSEFPEIEAITGNKLREKLRHLNQLREELRNRFRSEYLGQLVQRINTRDNYKFHIGEIVLVASDDKKRLEWPMARVLELIKGTDGEIRVAKIKTEKGELVRSLQRLIPMEVGSDVYSVDNTVKVRARAIEEVKTPKAVVKKRSKKGKNRQQEDKNGQENLIMERVTRYGRKTKPPIRYN